MHQFTRLLEVGGKLHPRTSSRFANVGAKGARPADLGHWPNRALVNLCHAQKIHPASGVEFFIPLPWGKLREGVSVVMIWSNTSFLDRPFENILSQGDRLRELPLTLAETKIDNLTGR
jgi:hypothetical protein